jgi:regulator of CtrA degradation
MTDTPPPPDTDSKLEETLRDFTASELFTRTFTDGMAMVEETASYLDGPGREESRTLPRKVALAYAGESMRLTTRLMQVASWLLVQRAVKDGEMAASEAAQEKYRLGAREICQGRALEAAEQLPARLLDLLERSRNLYERVERLDDLMYRKRQAPIAPVKEQHSRIAEAFGIGNAEG